MPDSGKEDNEKGVVPFLRDVAAAFLSTLVLMVFGVNFLLFTSLSIDGLDEVFNTGEGLECNPPCLSYPSQELVKDAMVERQQGLRRALCTRAYGKQPITIGSITLKDQECQGCNPWPSPSEGAGAYLLILWDAIVSLITLMWRAVRAHGCFVVKALKVLEAYFFA
jgi:hypothetical protein